MKQERFTEEKLNQIPHDILVSMHLQLSDSFDVVIRQNEELIRKVSALEEQIAVLTQRMFGRKTEKLSAVDPNQISFDFPQDPTLALNEAEKLTEAGLPEEPAEETVIIRRKKPKGKRAMDLRYVETVNEPPFTIPEEKLKELFPKGYTRLADESYSKLEHVPERFIHHRYTVCVYAGNHGEGIIRADRPEQLLQNSLLTPSLFSSIVDSKIVNAIPLNRLAEDYARKGVNLSRQDMAGWMIKITDRYLTYIYRAMTHKLLSTELIHCDETPFTVIQDGRSAGSKSYMWVYHTSQRYGSPPIYIYQYDPGRSTKVPREFLEEFKGVLLTDGYQVYHKLAKERADDLKVAGCWAHTKRRFAELQKSAVKGQSSTISAEAVRRIAAIYHADNMYKDASDDERVKHRQESVKPLVDSYFDWMKGIDTSLMDHSGSLYTAIRYSLNQEPFLRYFLENPIVPLDNNDAERSIRKFCVGKHSWHVIATPNGARSSAILYSIAETAKANGLRPYEYFKYVLSSMLQHMDDKPEEYIDDLMPWSDCLPENVREYKF